MNILKYLNYISILILLNNCTGFYTYFYSYHKSYQNNSKFTINGKLKIAIYLNNKESDEVSFKNLNSLKQNFEKSNLQIITINNFEKNKSFDLIIMKYYIEDASGLLETVQDTSIFLSYVNMILTLGIYPGMNHKLKIHTIELLNPSIDKVRKIEFVEHIYKNDGWIANYLGKRDGKFSEDYNRYYIYNQSVDEHAKNLLNFIEKEGILSH